MNISNSHRLDAFPTLARIAPLSLTIMMILYAMMLPSFNSFYLVILILLSNVFNSLLKNAVMKPIYKWSGGNNLFLLGIGSRPPGAINCKFALDGIKSTSFGIVK